MNDCLIERLICSIEKRCGEYNGQKPFESQKVPEQLYPHIPALFLCWLWTGFYLRYFWNINMPQSVHKQ